MLSKKYGIMITGLSVDQVDRIERQFVENSDELSGIMAASYNRYEGRVTVETYRENKHPEAEPSFYNAMSIINDEIRKIEEA